MRKLRVRELLNAAGQRYEGGDAADARRGAERGLAAVPRYPEACSILAAVAPRWKAMGPGL